MLYDIHCHLNHADFSNDISQVIERAKNAGVKRIICSGTNSITNDKILQIAKNYPDIVRCSLGIYPLDLLGVREAEGSGIEYSPTNINDEFKKLKNKEFIAIGEVGMDFATPSNQEEQKKNFAKIIELTEKTGLPILIHSRKAEQECIEMLETSKLKKVIMHCFTGKKNLVKKAADHGYYFSIPPIITRLPQFKIIAEIVNINQLLTETDSPWLGAVSGERNEPANVRITVERIAEIKGMTAQETENNLWLNYQRMFE